MKSTTIKRIDSTNNIKAVPSSSTAPPIKMNTSDKTNNSTSVPTANAAAAAPNQVNVVHTPSDFLVDDSLTLFDRVVKYTDSTIALQRVVHVRLLAEAVRDEHSKQCYVRCSDSSSGEGETLSCIDAARRISMDLVPKLCNDEYSVVRQTLPLQLKEVAVFCLEVCKDQDNDDGRMFVLKDLVGQIGKIFLKNDTEVDVRRAASEVRWDFVF